MLGERQRAQDIAAIIDQDLRDAGLSGADVGVRSDNVGSKVEGFNDYNIGVEGHTDDIPIGPALARIYKSNWEPVQ